jgi:hypothetical protein
MKFEKFFKSTGTHGVIVKRSVSESWLICGGVGMMIPNGVNNLGVSGEPTDVFTAIVNSDADDDYVRLVSAILPEADGKAKDIIRIFETDLGERVGICNADFGLLEKHDRLTYLEIEADDPDNEGETKTTKYIVVRNHQNYAVGFITGVDYIA